MCPLWGTPVDAINIFNLISCKEINPTLLIVILVVVAH